MSLPVFRRVNATALVLALSGWSAAALADPVNQTPPADFAAAASACVDAVAPDGLDAGKLIAGGWTKQSDAKAPFGDTAIYARAGNAARIYASPSPTGYCIVDGYGRDLSQFELYKDAVAQRLKADYGTPGLTEVSIGKPGADDRRQGFMLGNAVAGYSAVMRADGLNLRFTVVNAKFAGSATTFQTARPPLSEAEISENRARSLKDLDFARGNGTAQDLVGLVGACTTALRGNAALPADDGWQKSIHASGTPHSLEAMKNRDFAAMTAGMANTRQLLYRAGSRRGLITKYFVRGEHKVCEATVFVDPAQAEAIKADTIAALHLGKDGDPSGKARDFAAEYALVDLTRTWQREGSELAIRQAHGTSLDSPDPAKATLSVFVF